jgi:hypothetical protein
MTKEGERQRAIVDAANLPADFPTHRHEPAFWEALGRAVATFGFLEEVLGKAIFAFTATREIPEEKIETEFAKWLPTLRKALQDPLGGLIGEYEKAVRANSSATISNLDELVQDLRAASKLRNVLCHGSWRTPDSESRSLPHFVDNKGMVFATGIDVSYLLQIQRHTADLAHSVINSVTHMGWQFPGASGPGEPILRRNPCKA